MKSIKFSIDNIATINIAYSSKSKLFAIIKIFPNFGSTGNLANNFPISVIVVLFSLFLKKSKISLIFFSIVILSIIPLFNTFLLVNNSCILFDAFNLTFPNLFKNLLNFLSSISF